MAVQTLRPSVVAVQAGWTQTGGASPADAMLDNSDASYMDDTVATGDMITNFADLSALDPGEQVRWVRPIVRWLQVTGSGNAVFRIRDEYSGAFSADNVFNLPNAFRTDFGAFEYVAPGTGGGWTEDLVNRTQILVSDPAGYGSSDIQVAELYLDVGTNKQPVATPTTGTLTTSSNPVIDWAYSDPEGDAQERFQLKVFASGFAGDPETATPLYYSGEIFSSSPTHTLTESLDNATYKFYVKAADVGSGGRYSEWASATRTLTVDTPESPRIMTVTTDPTNGRVVLGIRSRLNILRDEEASLETTAISATSGWSPGTDTALTRSTTFAMDGTNSLRLANSSGGAADIGMYLDSKLYPLAPAEPYTFLLHIRHGGAPREVRMHIEWYDAADALISFSTGTPLFFDTGSFSIFYFNAVSPALTAKAVPIVEFLAVAGGGAEFHYVDKMLFSNDDTISTWSKASSWLDALTHSMIIERSTDGGTTWVFHGAVDEQTFISAREYTSNNYDYLTEPQTPTRWRARNRLVDEYDSSVYTSPYSAATSDYTLTLTDWWLTDATDNYDSAQVKPYLIGSELRTATERDVSIYKPLGRSKVVAVSDVTRGDIIDLMMEFESEADYNKFDALRRSNHTLVLKSPWVSQQWFLQLESRVELIRTNTSPPLWRVHCSAHEVDLA